MNFIQSQTIHIFYKKHILLHLNLTIDNTIGLVLQDEQEKIISFVLENRKYSDRGKHAFNRFG